MRISPYVKMLALLLSLTFITGCALELDTDDDPEEVEVEIEHDDPTPPGLEMKD